MTLRSTRSGSFMISTKLFLFLDILPKKKTLSSQQHRGFTSVAEKKIDGDMQTSHQAPSLHCACRHNTTRLRAELFINVISLHRFMVISPFYSPMSQNVVEKWELMPLSDNISTELARVYPNTQKNFINLLMGLQFTLLSDRINTEAYHYVNKASCTDMKAKSPFKGSKRMFN
jgi:hypothetical protein